MAVGRNGLIAKFVLWDRRFLEKSQDNFCIISTFVYKPEAVLNPLVPNQYNCTYVLFLFLRSNC